ncbi:hypothetical protein ACCO45_001682 [Purpureocillium lilacinum]|uniref:Uncharacterized protein n=1 Tax=Purpureocillium lilacinum TaxID=33203 RepID=A0ACC4E8L6_PURLI
MIMKPLVVLVSFALRETSAPRASRRSRCSHAPSCKQARTTRSETRSSVEREDEGETELPRNLGVPCVEGLCLSPRYGWYDDHGRRRQHFSNRCCGCGFITATAAGQDERCSSRDKRPSVVTAAPRVTIQFCTQCKWMLRAAYVSLCNSAFPLNSIFARPGLRPRAALHVRRLPGEVALQPSTGGTFVVTIVHQRHSSVVAVAGAKDQDQAATVTSTTPATTTSTVLWDRKVDGGFPETKELKRRVRDVIEPGRDLGHVDRHHGPPAAAGATTATATTTVTGTGPGTTGTVATKGGEVEGMQADTRQIGGQRCEDCAP